MGCHNCSPSKKDDEAKPLKKHNKADLHMAPQISQTDFTAEKLYQSTVAKDSLDKLFRKILQSYQAKVIPFSNTTLADIPSTHETTMPSLNNSFRLQHELKLAAEVLPLNTGSSIFLFVNENDPSMLKALITGPAYTPYAHGLFEFDIFLQDGMDLPPRVQFNTTGDGSVNFSTYLPASGVIDMSLLNAMSFATNETTAGGAASNISNLVLSLQNLLRASGIFGNTKDAANNLVPESPEGMREYKAYCNVIKYATVQYAMLEYLENSPPELAEFVQTYFYIKRDIILKECKKWLAEAQLDNGNYDTIVSKYNPEFARELRNGAYFVRLNVLVMRLEELIAGISLNHENPLLEKLRRKTLRETISANTF